jgi:transposase-like protein
MLLERSCFLQAEPYERTEVRQDQANGFKPKTLKTRVGELSLNVPQVRNGGFYLESLEKGLRSEKALKLALAEMYVQGVSTRKVAAITEKLCGFDMSSAQVSRAAAELDEILDTWRNRPLGACPYVFLDARYEKVRQGGIVQDAAVLVAVGVQECGKRSVLGVSVALSEHEAHWRSFMKSLVERGLCGVRLIISDNHLGLKAARTAVFGALPWQRCQFHLQQNAQAYVPKVEMRKQVAEEIRSIFNAKDEASARLLLSQIVQSYEKTAPKLAVWMEKNLPEGFTVFSMPASHRTRLRTTNGLERLNKEIKRRTRVACLFPSEASCLRLVSAVLMEFDEDWLTNRIYLEMKE